MIPGAKCLYPSQKGEEDEKAAILGQCHTKPMTGQKMWAVETVTLHNSHLLDLMFYSKMDFIICLRSSDPAKSELATWKTLGVIGTTNLIAVLTSDAGILDLVNFNKPATHLERVCWGPLSLISLEPWYFYVSA